MATSRVGQLRDAVVVAGGAALGGLANVGRREGLDGDLVWIFVWTKTADRASASFDDLSNGSEIQC